MNDALKAPIQPTNVSVVGSIHHVVDSMRPYREHAGDLASCDRTGCGVEVATDGNAVY